MTTLDQPATAAGLDDAAASDNEPTLTELGLVGFAPYLINRIAACYNNRMTEELRVRGLTVARMRALAVLSVQPGLTVNELAVYAVMEQSTMSRTLDAMAVAGLVERRSRAADGRVREVALTESGRTLFLEVWPLMRDAEARMLVGLDLEERATFIAMLRKILKATASCPA